MNHYEQVKKAVASWGLSSMPMPDPEADGDPWAGVLRLEIAEEFHHVCDKRRSSLYLVRRGDQWSVAMSITGDRCGWSWPATMRHCQPFGSPEAALGWALDFTRKKFNEFDDSADDVIAWLEHLPTVYTQLKLF